MRVDPRHGVAGEGRIEAEHRFHGGRVCLTRTCEIGDGAHGRRDGGVTEVFDVGGFDADVAVDETPVRNMVASLLTAPLHVEQGG